MQSLKLLRYSPNNLDRLLFSLLSRNINSKGATAASISPLSSGHRCPYSGLLSCRHELRNQHHSVAMAPSPVKYLAQQEAIDVDQELFNEYQFSVDQLMEMAGISCAVAIARHYPHLAEGSGSDCGGRPDVLIVCGPGNNGGDGLVCARHLRLFGFRPSVYYPVQKPVPLYTRLAHQCQRMGIAVEEQPPTDPSQFRLVVDALFGFSFRPPVRPQLEPAMQLLKAGSSVCSIDVPSGWHVEEGPADAAAVQPDLLVSLTAPKLCAKFFKGAHYLGGRFVPPSLAEKYALNLPDFPGTDCVVQLN